MDNIVFINQKGRGYGYTSFSDENRMITPDDREFFENFRPRLSDFCELRPNTFSVFFCRRGKTIFFSYGIFLPGLKDDRGREGLHFAHCIILYRGQDLYPSVLNLLKLLGSEGREQIYKILNTIAKADSSKILELQNFLTFTFRLASAQSFSSALTTDADTPKIKKITHDIGGLSAYVWLLLAELKSRDPENWMIYESLERGKTVTETSDPGIEVDVSYLLKKEKSQSLPEHSPELSLLEEIKELRQSILRVERIVLGESEADSSKTKNETRDHEMLGRFYKDVSKLSYLNPKRIVYFFVIILIFSGLYLWLFPEAWQILSGFIRRNWF